MREINGMTKVCGLIGNPVKHSISPLIHNHLAEQCGIDLAYAAFKVESAKVKNAVLGAYELGVLGLNVTVPHKEEVIGALSDIDPLAKHVGAVNTLVRTENGYKGYNTDILGFHRQLTEADIRLSGSDVIILGAGGAARAVAFLCAKEKVNSLYILNRTGEKADMLANEVLKVFQQINVIPMELQEYGKLPQKQFITVQTTSVGLYPNTDSVVIDADAFYDRVSVGIDIIYNPAKTSFMKLVEGKNKKAYNGMKMLLYQGVSAFELWNHIQVSKEIIAFVYEQMKKELKLVE